MSSYAQGLLAEFEYEMASTRNVLERIPDDKFEWRAPPKSNTIGWNANHVTEIPGWAVAVIQEKSIDIAPVDGPRYVSPKLTTTAEVLELFDRNVAAAKAAIAAADPASFGETWTLEQGGVPIIQKPRAGILRSIILNHLIHHRAHLCVYLRLNDVPVPGMYGPTGDE